jgi:hypothetical protein
MRHAGLMLICFILVAGPYIVWLSQHTGEFRLETKSLLNVMTELRIQQGLPDYAASSAVSPELVAEGVWVQPNIDVISGARPSVGDYVGLIAKKYKNLLRDAAKTIAGSLEFGGPVLFALAVLGLFGKPWRGRIVIDQLQLLILLSLSVLALFFISYLTLRFFLLFLVVFCIWASAGLSRLSRWARRTAAAAGHAERARVLVGRAVAALALTALLVPAGLYATGAMVSARGSRPIEALGSSLATVQGPLRIADTSPVLAFHARADFVWLPYSDEETALKYLRSKQVTHVVPRLRSDMPVETPYLRKWVENGVPESRLVAEARSADGTLVRVYRLNSSR